MKKLFLYMLCTMTILLSSCGNSNSQLKYVITETPIQDELLGVKIGQKSSESEIKMAVEKYTPRGLSSYIENRQGRESVKLVPLYADNFAFAGHDWSYIDILLNQDNEITSVRFVFSADEYSPAATFYNSVKETMSEKYGKAKEIIDESEPTSTFCAWRDDTLTLLLMICEIVLQDGSRRTFCGLTYTTTSRN